jgi:hypothetical protein
MIEQALQCSDWQPFDREKVARGAREFSSVGSVNQAHAARIPRRARWLTDG